jgi:Kef-type K+ transport system membrane component KefB
MLLNGAGMIVGTVILVVLAIVFKVQHRHGSSFLVEIAIAAVVVTAILLVVAKYGNSHLFANKEESSE